MESQSEAGIYAVEQTGHQDRTCATAWRSSKNLSFTTEYVKHKGT